MTYHSGSHTMRGPVNMAAPASDPEAGQPVSYQHRSRSSRGAARTAVLAALALLPLACTLPALAQSEASAIVTVLPKTGETPTIPQQQIQVSVDGKHAEPTVWRPYGHGNLELVMLIDSSARTTIGTNLEDLAKFIANLPPNVAVGVAYMQNGVAQFTGPMSTDHAGVAKQLHLPSGSAGSTASPYFCLSDLAKRWPSPRSQARREVVMVTDGVDRYSLRYDPDNPYIKSAVNDSQRAGLVVYSIYYRDQGRLSNSEYETNAGQSYLTQIADETGGNLYYEGLGNPVSFLPFLSDLNQRLMNQYELGFPVRTQKKDGFVTLKVKSEINNVKLKVAEHVAVQGEGK